MYVSRVDPSTLAFSLASHRHSSISLFVTFEHNPQSKNGTGDSEPGLDVKAGLLTGLLTGIQSWKCPVALSQTCYGSKSLKVILMDSNFGGRPVLNPLVTL